ncbi:OmpA family protein [Acinetobacter towneri]|uniref:OmpA family protein n=1 Tax=Acinetobacter towneri TaxID=202956 RepID=UPI00188B7D15|nr:OmpA family protein [Acinetobacter towneri]MBF4521243.1 OmpA family protein [Acinetobacter towneri]
MQTDFIDLLKQSVSSIVLEGETQHLLEKNQALNSFYPILLSILNSRPELIDNLHRQLNPRVGDVFGSNLSLKQQFMDMVSGTAPQAEIENTLNRSIAPSLNFLENQAGSSDPVAIQHLLQNNLDSIQAALPQWATALLAALGVNNAAGQTVHQAPEVVVAEPVEERRSWLLPILALIILIGLLAFLFRACSDRDQVPATTQTQVAANQAAMLQVSTGSDSNLITCQILLNNPSYMEILQKEVKQIFNQPTGCGAENYANYHSEFIDQDVIPSVLKMLKGVPNVNLNWVGNQLSIQAANPADAERLASQIRPLAKNMTVVTQQPVETVQTDVNHAVTTSISNAEQALAAINPDNIQALDIATALNMQIINFDSASTQIPEANKSILDQAAVLMQRASQVHLTVKGHTDAVGDANANKTLSQQRAQAVVDYLVSRGVNPGQLQAVGFGSEQPIAANATPEGQFKNRRIEFEVLNVDTGTVRSVEDAGVVEQKVAQP